MRTCAVEGGAGEAIVAWESPQLDAQEAMEVLEDYPETLKGIPRTWVRLHRASMDQTIETRKRRGGRSTHDRTPRRTQARRGRAWRER